MPLERTSLFLFAFLVLPCTGFGQDDAEEQDRTEVEAATDAWLEGHSQHGEAFNEGPRQAAYLMPDASRVHFPVMTANEETQAFVDQGVGQLHGFWYFEAERSFRQAAALDPDCAMAYWGMAMANVDNEERAKGLIHEAWKRRDNASDREQKYIDAWAKYYDADKELPEEEEAKEKADDEAAEADAGSDSTGKVSDPQDRTDRSSTSDRSSAPSSAASDPRSRSGRGGSQSPRQRRAQQLVKDLEELIYEYPEDLEAKAFLVNQLWLNTRSGIQISSRQANQALLDQVFAAHPMHPAHHYRIHLWDTQETAYRAVDSAARSGQSYPSIAHMWHMGGHIFAQLGRHSDAAWQQEASARTDHAHMIRDLVLPDQIHNFAHNNEWLTRSLRHCGRVHEAIDLAKNMIEMPRHPQYNTLEKRGTSASYGRQRLVEVLDLFERWDEMVDLSETMYLEPSENALYEGLRISLLGKALAMRGELDRARTQVSELEGLLQIERDLRSDEVDEAEEEALAENKNASEVEEALTEAVTSRSRQIQDLHRGIRGLNALIALKDGGDPEEQLKILQDSRFESPHLARLYAEAGLAEEAERLASKDRGRRQKSEAYSLANHAYVLETNGKGEEAAEKFEELREKSAELDLDMAVFQRLAPLAERLGHEPDWRVEKVLAEDIGERVDLDTLGPFRWSPGLAKPWELPDGFGSTQTLAQYQGKPIVLIFFLGFGCVHCVEQLQAFQPAAQQYADSGLTIVTIGTDSVADLTSSQENDTPETRYPFPIMADPGFTAFKEYRCYDDFEDMPLHGTFLIDAEGRIRWQDISFEPFMEPEFLLEEAQRLLGLPPVAASLQETGAGSD